MKRISIILLIIIQGYCLNAQINELAPNYKIIDIGWNGYGDFTRSLILLHEIYNGNFIVKNYAIGTIQAMRGSTGSWDRTNIVNVNTSSGYNGINGAIQSFDNSDTWKLKTCFFNGKKYLAVEVPYNASYHDNGIKFCGWTYSTGESMKCVSYEVNGQPVNQDILTNISDFSPTMNEYHNVANLIVNGNLGIGTPSPQNALDVKGTIRAKEVKVTLDGWPDIVFKPSYKLKPLNEVEQYINTNGHLPEIPSETEVKENGVNVGDMQAKLLQKVEELTLYVIDLKKENQQLRNDKDKELADLKKEIEELKKK